MAFCEDCTGCGIWCIDVHSAFAHLAVFQYMAAGAHVPGNESVLDVPHLAFACCSQLAIFGEGTSYLKQKSYLQKFRFEQKASSPNSSGTVKSPNCRVKVQGSSHITSPQSQSQSAAGAEVEGQFGSSQEDLALSGASQASLTPSEEKLLRCVCCKS